MTLTPEDIAKYCPEDWQRYMDCKHGDIPCYCGYIETKAQARKERDTLKQALEQVKAETDCESVHQEEALSEITRIAEQTLASITACSPSACEDTPPC